MIKYFIWDFDGVICDSRDVAFNVHNKVRKNYKSLPTINNGIEYARLMNGEYDESLERYLTKKEKDSYFLEHREEMYRRKAEFKVFNKIVNFIQDENIPSIIITATYEKLVKYILKNNGYDEKIFENILGRETEGGKSEKICKTLEKLNLDSSEVVYIGDTLNDVNFCNKMGINIIAVGYGYCPKKVFKDSDIFSLCNTQEELIKFINQISK